MKDNKDIELAKIAPVLSGMSKENPYRVPEDYFDASSLNIMEAIQFETAYEEIESPALSAIKKENVFVTPVDYFEELSAQINSSINKLEIAGEAPVLASIKTTNAFEVPPAYFDNLASQIQFKIRKEEEQQSPGFWQQLATLFKPQFAAPVVMGCLVLWIGLRMNSSTSLKPVELSSNDASWAMENSYLAQMDESLLIDALDENKLNDAPESNLETEDYLVNNVDVSTLTEEL